MSILSSGDCATLLTWIEGETITEVTEEVAQEAGALAARMRRALSARAELHSLLDRYAYDEGMVERLCGLLSEGFGGEDIADMDGALAAIRGHMGVLRTRDAEFGLIHADLSRGNLIRSGRGLVPIDFCLSGRGFYAQDLSGLVADFGERFRGALIDGYSAAGDRAVEARSLDVFVALGVLLYLASHWRGAKGEEWFPGALQRWRRTLFRPLFA